MKNNLNYITYVPVQRHWCHRHGGLTHTGVMLYRGDYEIGTKPFVYCLRCANERELTVVEEFNATFSENRLRSAIATARLKLETKLALEEWKKTRC